MKKTTKFIAMLFIVTGSAFTAAAQGNVNAAPNGNASESVGVLPNVKSQSYLGAEIGYSSGKAEITSITPNTPAEMASLKKGDVITSIGTINIASEENYAEAMKIYKPGEDVKISFTRKGKSKQRTITLAKITSNQ